MHCFWAMLRGNAPSRRENRRAKPSTFNDADHSQQRTSTLFPVLDSSDFPQFPENSQVSRTNSTEGTQVKACSVRVRRLCRAELSTAINSPSQMSKSDKEIALAKDISSRKNRRSDDAVMNESIVKPCSVKITQLSPSQIASKSVRSEVKQARMEIKACSIRLRRLSRDQIAQQTRAPTPLSEDAIRVRHSVEDLSDTTIDLGIKSFYEYSLLEQHKSLLTSMEEEEMAAERAKFNRFTSVGRAPSKSEILDCASLDNLECDVEDREPYFSDPTDQLDRGSKTQKRINVGKMRLKVGALKTQLQYYPTKYPLPNNAESLFLSVRWLESIARGPKRSEVTGGPKSITSEEFHAKNITENVIDDNLRNNDKANEVEMGDIDSLNTSEAVKYKIGVARVRRDSNDSVGSSISNISSIPSENEPELLPTLNEQPSETLNSREKSIDNTVATKLSGISGPSADNTHAFKLDLRTDYTQATAKKESRFVTMMSMEVFCQSRDSLLPDPKHDALCALFITVKDETLKEKKECIMIVSDKSQSDNQALVSYCDQRRREPNTKRLISFYESEISLLATFIQLVKVCDPDLVLGYEVQQSSWGYVIERGSVLQVDVLSGLSRVHSYNFQVGYNKGEGEEEKTALPSELYASRKTSELQLAGRIVLNVWRLLRSEVAFNGYTFENMMFHVLHHRTPKHEQNTLMQWWTQGTNQQRFKVLDYYRLRSAGNIMLLDKFDFVGRTSELARLFGIQFEEVISRGSQFRVESILLRRARRQNCVAVSPSIQQRAKMRAPEYLPLILEPESRLYNWPVLVLDFQSLYPSIIIAYNYCYSTCIGRIALTGGQEEFEFGATKLKLSLDRVKKLQNHLNFSPLGVGFVQSHIFKGLLPKMLEDILEARLMVKRSMKLHKNNDTLQRVLHARQLGLKLIANVTYGYTSANFSGRMPCIEVGDSVVSKGRETLERAITTIESKKEWGAKVVYGDTDSIFVLLKGKSREEAFRIGNEMAQQVTNENPKPVKLKFEKVYEPCILQTKKRYVGFMYETPDQKDPMYEAKGIETVRRDGCPAVVKMLEKTLRLLFSTKDMSIVKSYVQRQFSKLLSNTVSLQDLTFAKEFRGLDNYRPSAVVPALEIARRKQRSDARNVPRIGERVPYIIVHGRPGEPLINSVRTPLEVVSQNLRPNANYYIVKVIAPPLDRCLSLVGADVNLWFSQMPRRLAKPRLGAHSRTKNNTTLSQFFRPTHCFVCFEMMNVNGKANTSPVNNVCSSCLISAQRSVLTLVQRTREDQRLLDAVNALCNHCTRHSGALPNDCYSFDCPIFYKRQRFVAESEQVEHIAALLQDIEEAQIGNTSVDIN